MKHQMDECGWPLLVEGVGKVRRESVQSLAAAARRSGSIVVVLGDRNTKVQCEVCTNRVTGLRWFVDDWEVPSSRIVTVLEELQGEEP